jgi:Ca-activated chloride channel family protein
MFTLPEIFAQESAVVQRYYITEETFQPRIGQVEPLLSGLKDFPQLHGYVATSAKPLANVSLSSHREDPVLAFWRHGLGQTVAFTSDPVGPWGESWLKWDDWESFWSQTARYLARTDEPAHFQVSFASNGSNTTVLVDTLDEPGSEEGSKFQGTLIDSTGKEHTVQFQRSSSGRYEAVAPVSGSLFGKVFRIRDDAIQEAAIVQYSTPGGQESDLSGNGRERLAQLTGRLVNSADQLRTNSKTASDVQPIRKQLLFWALWLFLFDVSARKLDMRIFRRRKLPQTLAPVTNVPLQKLKMRKLEVEKTRPVWIDIENAPVIDSPQEEMPKQELQPSAPEKSEYMERLKEAKRRKL